MRACCRSSFALSSSMALLWFWMSRSSSGIPTLEPDGDLRLRVEAFDLEPGVGVEGLVSAFKLQVHTNSNNPIGNNRTWQTRTHAHERTSIICLLGITALT